ncbi:MAG: hypothetical protein BRD50_05450 [Bacteroidetes bacterium SW_11_45_7]|jgi:hypothetical protein|nr:MAG: hypothetical protein BRD50_05450 [Bacteroidetes bacterium SW_11_45_7]
MELLLEFFKGHPILLALIFVWEAFWKLIAMWKSARKNQIVWFLCIALIHIIGILPIIYLLTNDKKEEG